jgi:uncharacterized membrane protein SpoIIM required for sporulation
MPDNTSNQFINERKGAWQRLEDLLSMIDSSSLRSLTRDEVRELGHIYRRTASDLAIARVESRDPRLINYLNSLVIRAHGRIYRAESGGAKRIRQFFAYDFPQTFRRTWKYTAISFGIFLIFGVISFLGIWSDPEFSEVVGIDPYFREVVIRNKVRWWQSLNEANQVGASQILTNNIGVTLYAYALGAMFGIGTLYILINNGLHIGGVLALTYRAGYGNELVTFMVGHGVIELSCIFISGGAGLILGSAILMPGNLSRLDALHTRGSEAIRLIMGSAPLLFLAGLIEGFISPAAIDPNIKFGVALLTGIGLYGYLLLAGRNKSSQV